MKLTDTQVKNAAAKAKRAYARGEHWDERVRMADWWADELQTYRELKS